MSIDYEGLKKIAIGARAELTLRGIIDPSKRRVRRRPRTEEKTWLLRRMALNRMAKYPPQRTVDGEIILPYFYET